MARRPNLFESSAFFDFFASGGGIDIAENARMQRKEFEGGQVLGVAAYKRLECKRHRSVSF